MGTKCSKNIKDNKCQSMCGAHTTSHRKGSQHTLLERKHTEESKVKPRNGGRIEWVVDDRDGIGFDTMHKHIADLRQNDSDSLIMYAPGCEILHRALYFGLGVLDGKSEWSPAWTDEPDETARNAAAILEFEKVWSRALLERKTRPSRVELRVVNATLWTYEPAHAAWDLYLRCGKQAEAFRFVPPSFSPTALKVCAWVGAITEEQRVWLMRIRGLERLSIVSGAGIWRLNDIAWRNADTLRYLEYEAYEPPSSVLLEHLKNVSTVSIRCRRDDGKLNDFFLWHPYRLVNEPHKSVNVLSLAPAKYSMLRNIHIAFPFLQRLYIEQPWPASELEQSVPLSVDDHPQLENLNVDATFEARKEEKVCLGAVTNNMYHWPLGPKLKTIEIRVRIPLALVKEIDSDDLVIKIVHTLKTRKYGEAASIWIIQETENDGANWKWMPLALTSSLFRSGSSSYSGMYNCRQRPRF